MGLSSRMSSGVSLWYVIVITSFLPSFAHSLISIYHLLNSENARVLPDTNSAVFCFHHAKFISTFAHSLGSFEIKLLINPVKIRWPTSHSTSW